MLQRRGRIASSAAAAATVMIVTRRKWYPVQLQKYTSITSLGNNGEKIDTQDKEAPRCLVGKGSREAIPREF